MGWFDLPEKTPLQKLKERRQASGRSLVKVALWGAVSIGVFVAALDYSGDQEVDLGNVAVAALLGGATTTGTKALLGLTGSNEAIALAISALEDASHQQERLTTVLASHRESAAQVQRELSETRSQTARLSTELGQLKSELLSTSSLLRELLSRGQGLAYQQPAPAPASAPTANSATAATAEFDAETNPWFKSLAEA